MAQITGTPDSSLQLAQLGGGVGNAAAANNNNNNNTGNAPVPATGGATPAPLAAASAVPPVVAAAPAVAPVVAAAPAAAPVVAAAPAVAPPAVTGPAFPFVSMDPNETRAGVALGVIPHNDLVYDPASIPGDASKYYAIVRGRFIGIFAHSSTYDYATRRVSNAIYWNPTTLGAAVDWFNAQRAMGLCEIVA